MKIVKSFIESFRPTHIKEVFFPALSFNRRVLFWYADKLVRKDSNVDSIDSLRGIDALRRSGTSLTFICNHLSYADSHVIETLLIRSGFKDLSDHLIHIAGQKTFQLVRRFMTRSLNTVRVYQTSARIDKQMRKKMNSRALKWAAFKKKRAYSVLVFPEGTRTRRYRRFNIYGANPRTAIYFRHSSVVPLALMGSEKIMPVGSLLPRPSAVNLRIGSPIDYDSIEQSIRDENPALSQAELRSGLMLFFMNRINSLLDPEYRNS